MTDKMQEYTESTGFILAFLVMTALIGVFAGEKAQFWFSLLVLSSMLILNATKFSYWLKKLIS